MANGKKAVGQSEAAATENGLAAARLGPGEVGGVEQPQFDRCSTRLPARDRGVHRLVLLGAARRLAYEASDCGLLSPDLAAGIRRVKGVKKIGVRLGNWLTPEQSQRLWNAPDGQSLKGKRDRALLAILLAGGLRRHEAVNLDFGHIQQREDHWAIVDLKGKAGHTRTVPMPGWVKASVDEWLQAANLSAGKLFRRVNKTGAPGATV